MANKSRQMGGLRLLEALRKLAVASDSVAEVVLISVLRPRVDVICGEIRFDVFQRNRSCHINIRL